MANLTRVIVGCAMLLGGLYLFAFGGSWAPFVLDRLPDSGLGSWMELVVPFLPMLCIGGGAFVYTSRKPR